MAGIDVKSVFDPGFKKYGRIIKGYNLSDVLDAMVNTPLPDDVVYVPSVPSLEALDIKKALRTEVFGGLPCQIGYCNGHNKALNALEYHRSSEINIAVTDMILMLGWQPDIESDFTYDTGKVEVFLVPKGTMIEVYATTLHYAPCHVSDDGFRCVVVLPKDTNTELSDSVDKSVGDNKLLFAKNKWLICHEESGVQNDGGFIGLKGENIKLDEA